eukprot:m51a1_g13653 hypothetical protein (143) ;mRNA; r:745-1303
MSSAVVDKCIADRVASVVRECRWLGRVAALKPLRSPRNREVKRALRAEARLARRHERLSAHRGVPRVVVAERRPEPRARWLQLWSAACLQFELMKGGSLLDARKVASDLTATTQIMHEHGVVHGVTSEAKLCDLGTAAAAPR